ncbi:hypothetical protein K466DRAFT_657640 [Polyporus arcularius HHB13444]|uniref:F-box domain-containing protein n=1 Tax=Polyporus arcularius HHB13444 TaxID=1314778 RepID=A0A5C3Q857_9APHY|nr:hypothetical protein K466DRAFT_657640 [Polyporus arcularius HHB13444]
MSMFDAQYGPKDRLLHLPFELLHIVADHTDQHTLTKLCLVNSALRDVAASRLYTDVCLMRPAAAVKCLRTLSKHPELAKYARIFTMHLAADTSPHLTDAFGRLLRCALCNMPLLVSLELNLGEDAPGQYLRGSPVGITHLALVCQWDADLSVWLGEQLAIHRFMFYGEPVLPISLDPSALPNLQSIYATAAVISSLVPGRPVERVFVTAYAQRVFTESTVEHMARSCKSSTGPVSAVHVMHRMHRAPSPPEETFRFLSAIPRHLPGLTKFSMQAHSYSFDEPLCEMFLQFVTGFRRLLYLDFLTKDRTGLSTSNLPQLARSLGERCPSLRSIRFSPAWFYAHYSDSEWVSVQDIQGLYKELATCMLAQAQSSKNRGRAILGVNTTKQSAVLSDPAVAPHFKIPSFREYQEMNSAFVKLHALRPRGSAAGRLLDLIASPEVDADWVSSMNHAYRTGSRVLRIAQGRGDSG